jgi:RNA polymerase sigma-70 factor (ECF subfamily)
MTFDEAVAVARTAWPTLAVPQSFAGYLAARAPEGMQLQQWLDRAPLSDCYLACACAEQSAAALKTFDLHILSRMGAFLSRLRPTADLVDEVTQLVRSKLLLAAAGRPPKILEYSGAGSLANWVRVLSVRTAIDLGRRAALSEQHVEIVGDEPALAHTADQELAHIKGLYRERLNAVLRRALAATSTEQRNLLRLHFVEGVTFDALAVMFKMHKVTVWRKIDAARTTVLVAARQIVDREWNIPWREFDSLMHMMESLIDVSLPSFLEAGASPL